MNDGRRISLKSMTLSSQTPASAIRPAISTCGRVLMRTAISVASAARIFRHASQSSQMAL